MFYVEKDLEKDLEKCFDSIKKRNKRQEDIIKYLEEENKKLKDEKYKDEELQKMKNSLDKMKEEYRLGFPITKEEKESIDKWIKEHEREKHGLVTDELRMKAAGTIGGRYVYRFIPTSIGVVGEIHCGCGDKYRFCELD